MRNLKIVSSCCDSVLQYQRRETRSLLVSCFSLDVGFMWALHRRCRLDYLNQVTSLLVHGLVFASLTHRSVAITKYRFLLDQQAHSLCLQTD